jgi:ankyrin repeat protein
MGSSGASLSSLSSPNKNISQSYSGTLGAGGMSTLQQQELLREQLTGIWNLFAKEGPSRKTLRRQEELDKMMKLRDREYRQKYGYTVSNYAEAIRNFDDATLEKIFQSGFPISTTVQHNNEFADVTYEFEDYNAKDYYFTGLEYAAIYGNTYAIKRLLELGANPNYLIDGMEGANNWYSWYNKYAAVHIAIFYDRFEAVKLLLPKTTMSKRFGNRDKPYEFAKKRKYFHILTLLEPYK